MRKVFLCLALIWFGTQPAMADGESDISGFIITSISGTNVTLSERFGTNLGDTTHLINLLDCYTYLQIDAPDICEEGIVLIADDGDTSSADTNDPADAGAIADTTDTESSDTDPTDVIDEDVPVETTDTVEDTQISDVAVTDAGDTTNSDDLPGSKPGAGKADDGDGPAAFRVTLSTDSFTDAEFGVAVGTSCSASEFPTSDSGSCVPVVGLGARTDFTDIEVDILMSDLLGTDCSLDSTYYVYFYVNDLAAGQMYVSQVAFDSDYTVPQPPTISEVLAGETNLTISWTDESNSNESSITYTLYYSEASFTSIDIAADESTIGSASNLTVTEYQLTDLSNYAEYYIGVIAEDSFGNQSEICDTTDLGTGTPVEVDDFFEHYKKSGGQEEGGMTGCFVATAAWGSPTASAVNELRAFRDEWLLSNEGGQALVALYYDQGPVAASTLSKHEWLRTIARNLLIPSIVFAKATRSGLGWLVLAGLLFWWALRRRKNTLLAQGETR